MFDEIGNLFFFNSKLKMLTFVIIIDKRTKNQDFLEMYLKTRNN